VRYLKKFNQLITVSNTIPHTPQPGEKDDWLIPVQRLVQW
jgi:hypothetical protein